MTSFITPTPATGYITQEKYLRGRTLIEIERILGFHTGRLSQGAIFYVLTEIPQETQFEMGGYTQVAEHHFKEAYGKAVAGLDVEALKKMLVKEVFTREGLNRLVKVRPNMGHNDGMASDQQYPPGLGVPQWKLTATISTRGLKVVTDYPNGRFM